MDGSEFTFRASYNFKEAYDSSVATATVTVVDAAVFDDSIYIEIHLVFVETNVFVWYLWKFGLILERLMHSLCLHY